MTEFFLLLNNELYKTHAILQNRYDNKVTNDHFDLVFVVCLGAFDCVLLVLTDFVG